MRVLHEKIVSSESAHDEMWARYRPLFPVALRARVESYRDWRDRQRSLVSKLLVCRALAEFGVLEKLLRSYSVLEGGRPRVVLPGTPDFNVSHSGDHVVCAVAEGGGRIGIDIERVRDLQIEDFENFFPPAVWRLIVEAADRVGSFFRYWTICEAVAKAEGCGICGPVRDLVLDGDRALYRGQVWHHAAVHIASDYACNVACNSAFSADDLSQ